LAKYRNYTHDPAPVEVLSEIAWLHQREDHDIAPALLSSLCHVSRAAWTGVIRVMMSVMLWLTRSWSLGIASPHVAAMLK